MRHKPRSYYFTVTSTSFRTQSCTLQVEDSVETLFSLHVSLNMSLIKITVVLSESDDPVRFIQSLCFRRPPFSFVPGNRYGCNCASSCLSALL